MKKKTKTIITIVSVCLIAALFLPYQMLMYEDGGSVEYRAVAYKLVFWDFFDTVYGSDSNIERLKKTEKTALYFFPDSLKDIDELKEIERAKGE